VSLFLLFFDNLSTLLGFSGAILGLSGALSHDAAKALLEESLFQRIVPAAGIMLFVGNVYYTWQAIRLSNKYKKNYTAQPYGLNTAGESFMGSSSLTSALETRAQRRKKLIV
jgi:AGZA family xanthine/uracil permease-like MFS transporter